MKFSNFFKSTNKIDRLLDTISKQTKQEWIYDDSEDNGNIYIAKTINGIIDMNTTQVYCCKACTIIALEQWIKALKTKIPN